MMQGAKADNNVCLHTNYTAMKQSVALAGAKYLWIPTL